MSADSGIECERADQAERELAEEKAKHLRTENRLARWVAQATEHIEVVEARAKELEGELAEAQRALLEAVRQKGEALTRVEAAEARAKELERLRLEDLATRDDIEARVAQWSAAAANLQTRVLELQALVNAALPHCSKYGCGKLATHSEPWEPGEWACDEHSRPPMGRVHYSKYVLALASDLTAKGK